MSSKTVSVIIPFCDHERFLAEAIESVLDQTYPAVELVLVDDGSTDTSASISKSYSPPAQYVQRPNGGAGAARNTGVRHATGDYLAFCDADDVWASTKLERQMAALDHAPVDVVFASVSEFHSEDSVDHRMRASRTGVPGALPSAVLMHRSTFQRIGPFAENMRVGEWFDWFVRMKDAGLGEVWLSEVLVGRRLHNGNTGRVRPEAHVEYPRILRSHLHRRSSNR